MLLPCLKGDTESNILYILVCHHSVSNCWGWRSGWNQKQSMDSHMNNKHPNIWAIANCLPWHMLAEWLSRSTAWIKKKKKSLIQGANVPNNVFTAELNVLQFYFLVLCFWTCHMARILWNFNIELQSISVYVLCVPLFLCTMKFSNST